MGITRTLNMIRNTNNWFPYLLYKLGGKKAATFTFNLNNNFNVTVPRVIQPEFKELFFEEVYIKHLPKNIVNIKNPIILDIGANVGFFTIYSMFKFMNPRVISFEPINRNYQKLLHNLSTADLTNITILNKAVNDTEGELVLKFNSDQDITTSASLFDNKYGSDEEVVATTTLEAVKVKYNLPKIDLLKLDCEGAEYNILYNTPKSFFDNVNCLSMETHVGVCDTENNQYLAQYIKELGFNVITTNNNFIWAFKDEHNWC